MLTPARNQLELKVFVSGRKQRFFLKREGVLALEGPRQELGSEALGSVSWDLELSRVKQKGRRDGKGVGRIAERVRQDVSLLLWKPPPVFSESSQELLHASRFILGTVKGLHFALWWWGNGTRMACGFRWQQDIRPPGSLRGGF